MTQEHDNNIPQDRPGENFSPNPTVRAEGPRSLLPGSDGLTPLDDPASSADPALRHSAGGLLTRIWAARRWWLAPLFAVLGGAAAAWPFVRTPALAAPPVKHALYALVRFESTGGRGGIGAGGRGGESDKELIDIVRTELQLISEPQIIATQVPGTELVRIESTADDRATGAANCNAIAERFIARCMARTAKPASVIPEPDPILLQKIKTLQARRQELSLQTSTFDIDQQQAIATHQIETFTTLRTNASDRRLEAVARLDRLGQATADGIVERFARIRPHRLDDEKTRDPLYQQAFKDQVASAKDYAGERGAGKTELHRDVILAADRMRRAETMANQRAEQLAALVDAALAREQIAAIADAKAEAAEAIKVADQQIVDAEKKLAECEEKVKTLAVERARRENNRTEISQIDLDLQRENSHRDQIDDIAKIKLEPSYKFVVVRRAEAAATREPPKSDPPAPAPRMETAAIFAGGGLGVGLLLTFATGGLRTPRRQPPRVTRVAGNPWLGVIPLAASMTRATAPEQKAAQLRIAEGFRHLRNGLLVHIGPIPPGEPHTLCVTSAHRGEGRSCVATGLAVSLAKAGQRVLLVDADLRNPDLNRIFSLPVAPGLSELIEGKADPGDAIVRTDTVNLSLLPAGTASVDPGELLAWQEIGNYLVAIGRLYDHVIIDSAALLETADAHHLVGCATGVLLVGTPAADPAEIEHTLEKLREKGAKLVGAVMNRA